LGFGLDGAEVDHNIKVLFLAKCNTNVYCGVFRITNAMYRKSFIWQVDDVLIEAGSLISSQAWVKSFTVHV